MDPLLTVLLQAASTLGTAALSKVAESAVGDAWAAVKNAIVRNRPDAHDAAKLVDALRASARSPHATQILQRLEQLNVTREAEIVDAIRALIETLEAAGDATTVNAPEAQNVYGDQMSSGPSTRTYSFNNKNG